MISYNSSPNPGGIKVAAPKTIAPGLGPVRKQETSLDLQLEASLESFSFKIIKCKISSSFTKIREARATIMDRSSGTVAGAFYKDTGDLLARANTVVLQARL